jgi:hypothetical protein
MIKTPTDAQQPGAAGHWLIDAQRRRESVERSMTAAHTASTIWAMMKASTALLERLIARRSVVALPPLYRLRRARG